MYEYYPQRKLCYALSIYFLEASRSAWRLAFHLWVWSYVLNHTIDAQSLGLNACASSFLYYSLYIFLIFSNDITLQSWALCDRKNNRQYIAVMLVIKPHSCIVLCVRLLYRRLPKSAQYWYFSHYILQIENKLRFLNLFQLAKNLSMTNTFLTLIVYTM